MVEEDITLEELLEKSLDELEGFDEVVEAKFGNVEEMVNEARHNIIELNNDVSSILATAGLDVISPTIGNVSRGVFGNNQFGSFVGNTATNLAGDFLQNGLNKVLVGRPKTSVSSRETQRSTDAVSQMRLSRSQQSALMLQELERGKRNL